MRSVSFSLFDVTLTEEYNTRIGISAETLQKRHGRLRYADSRPAIDDVGIGCTDARVTGPISAVLFQSTLHLFKSHTGSWHSGML